MQGRAFMDNIFTVVYATSLGRMVGFGGYCAMEYLKKCRTDDGEDTRLTVSWHTGFWWLFAHEGFALSGYVCYNLLSKRNTGNIALASSLISLSVCLPVLVGRFLLSERLSWVQTGGVFVAIVSGLLMSVPTSHIPLQLTGGAWAIGALLSFGCAQSIAASFHKSENHIIAHRLLLIASSTIFILLSVVSWDTFRFSWNHNMFILTLAQAMTVCGTPTLIYLSSLCGAARASTLSAGYTILPVVVGIGFMQNQINVWSTTGIALSLLAVCLVSQERTPTGEGMG